MILQRRSNVKYVNIRGRTVMVQSSDIVREKLGTVVTSILEAWVKGRLRSNLYASKEFPGTPI